MLGSKASDPAYSATTSAAKWLIAPPESNTPLIPMRSAIKASAVMNPTRSPAPATSKVPSRMTVPGDAMLHSESRWRAVIGQLAVRVVLDDCAPLRRGKLDQMSATLLGNAIPVGL